MAEVLRFFVQYEAVLYFVLGLGGIIYLYRFWLAWQEVRVAVYGLEREESRTRLNQAAIVLFILLVVSVIIFSMVTFVSSAMPVVLATPTLDLSVGSPFDQLETPQQTANVATATPLPTVSIDPEGCVANSINISSPEPGDVLQGAVEVQGTVDVPNFGFYKFEVARAQEELWLTIQAGRNVVRDGVLVENWDTSRLPIGDYVLQLLVTDSAGEELPPCRIPVRIEMPSE
jgi:hypothetical protein